MYKASSPVNIPAWNKEEVTAVETLSNSDFVSVSTTYVRMQRGRATVTNAAIPNFHLYDRARVTFGDVEVTGNPTSLALEVLGLTGEGIQHSLGVSEFENGAFPPVEFDVAYEKYAVRVSALGGGTSPEVSVKPLIQGFYRAATTSV